MEYEESQSELRLLEVLRSRKLVEDDATRLSNRLAQLRKEEERSHKRIQETRRRAAEILAARRRNEEIKAGRELVNKERSEELEAHREKILEVSKETQRKKLESIEAFARAKMGKVAETKEEKAALEVMLREQQAMEQMKVIEKKEAVQAMHREMREKSMIEKQKTLARVRQDYEQRLQDELRFQKTKEKEVQRMARLEMELINRLQKKQDEQRQAFEELEQVLGISKSASKAPSPSKANVGVPVSGEEAQLANSFGELDVGGTGSIATDQVGTLLEKLSLTLNPEQLARAQTQLDGARTGLVSYRDFVAWWRG